MTFQAGDAHKEADRVFAAYLKKRRLDVNDLIHMPRESIKQIRAEAIANRHLYPVTCTEEGWFYHGTAKARIPAIEENGLPPSEKDAAAVSRNRSTKQGAHHGHGNY